MFTGDRLVYASPTRDESRTWRVADIEVSSSDPFDLTVATVEREGWTRGPHDFRFQLKDPLTETDYQLLWKAVNNTKGNE